MKPVSVLLAEDEPDQRAQLVRLLGQVWPEADLVAVCANGDDALLGLAEHQPKVLFLDIRMPGTDGLEVARQASGRAHVVLTTAYEQYAVDAFEAGALDYLLKPVTAERLATTVERLKKRLTGDPPEIGQLIDQLRRDLVPEQKRQALRWITASAGRDVRMINVDDVLYFRSSNKYVQVVTADEEAVIRLSLKELLEQLDPEQFWQIHRSVIVAVGAIERVERNDLGKLRVHVRGQQTSLPVSSTSHERFRGM